MGKLGSSSALELIPSPEHFQRPRKHMHPSRNWTLTPPTSQGPRSTIISSEQLKKKKKKEEEKKKKKTRLHWFCVLWHT
jgi:hypothetical protein